MSQTIQASAISLKLLEEKFGIQENIDPQFFGEWQNGLPEIDAWEKQGLDRLKTGFLDLIKDPPLKENLVRMTVLYPLLFIAGFYLSPLQVKPEQAVNIVIEDEDGTIIEGRIDVLVLKNEFWILVIESKRASISLEEEISQLLSYMLANPQSDKPTFGMITNGGYFMFAKLVKAENPQYALSETFVLRNQGDLDQVLRILKRLAQF